MGELLLSRHRQSVRLRRWLRFKHKTRRSKGGSYPLSHLYETFGLRRRYPARDMPAAQRRLARMLMARAVSLATGTATDCGR